MATLTRFAWFLVPGLAQGVLSFVMLPIATLRLDAADYGAFGLMVALTALGTSVAMLGSGYRFAAVFGRDDRAEESSVVTAQLVASTAMLVAAGAALAALWWLAARRWDAVADVTGVELALSIGAMVGTSWWLTATEVLTLTRRARMFAAGMLLQSFTNAGALAISLFGFDADRSALYVATFAASLAALVAAVIALRPYIIVHLPRQRLREVWSGIGMFSVSNTAESGYQVIERALLSGWTSLSHLGLYVHALQYRALMSVAVKAGARSVWGDTLEEARQGSATFDRTRKIWALLYLFMTLFGLTLATIGREFIGLLTHGKFTDAAPYAAGAVAILLAQNLGKPQTAILYAHGKGLALARMTVLSLVAAVIAAFFLVPLLGVWGAIVAGLLQSLTLRVQIFVLAKRLAPSPGQDRLAVLGLIALLIQIVYDGTHMTSAWTDRAVVCAVLTIVLIFMARRELRDIWGSRHLLRR